MTAAFALCLLTLACRAWRVTGFPVICSARATGISCSMTFERMREARGVSSCTSLMKNCDHEKRVRTNWNALSAGSSGSSCNGEVFKTFPPFALARRPARGFGMAVVVSGQRAAGSGRLACARVDVGTSSTRGTASPASAGWHAESPQALC